MKWKLKLTGKIIVLLFILLVSVIIRGHAQYRYSGIQNPPQANIYWENYTNEVQKQLISEILDALKISVSSLDLFEYSFVVEELLQSFQNDAFKERWITYMDSLSSEAMKGHMRSGLIPLQAQFFLATLKANPDYQEQYSEAFEFISSHTTAMNGLEWRPEQYEEILERFAFSDALGEGIMLEFLMLEDVYLLEIINNNPKLKDRFLIWVENLGDIANEFRFNEVRPREMFTRKKFFLTEKLKKSDHPLARISWEPISQIRTGRIHPTPPDSFYKILNGTWQGSFADKEIRISIYPVDNVNPERKLTGFNKFTTQDDIKQIDMRGTFGDSGDHFEVTMEEYRLPYDEEPAWKREIIEKYWGGPEKFYPAESSYGVFNVTVDKKSQIMKGTWKSNNGQLIREFEIPKISEGTN
jgi:hypothetical protein